MAILVHFENGLTVEVDGDVALTTDERAELTARFGAAITRETRLSEDQPQSTPEFALIGLAARMPGADSLDDFWKCLLENRDAIASAPAVRGDLTGGLQGAFLHDVDQFDATLFGISAREAEFMDPQHRILLEVCWEALERAGYAGASLWGARVGVFMGASGSEYAHRFIGHPEIIDRYFGSGNALSMVANRISYQFNFRGPSIAIDTACSSSLVALQMATERLARQECDVALVGGVNLLFSPEMYENCRRAKMLAADSRCKTFDDRADGYVRSEGAAVVVIKRKDDAARDRDHVWATIQAATTNHDGRSNGLTSPNGPSQVALLRQIYAPDKIPPNSISYIEAHGTGTQLGDTIEVQSLAEVFAVANQFQSCAIGTLKTQFGHLEPAAGIASVVKVVLALRHGQIPPLRGLQSPNRLIEFERTPFYVVDRAVSWPRTQERVRRACVSAFGFGGANAHVVLEEPPHEAPQRSTRRQRLFLISAQNQQTLARLAQRHLDQLAEYGERFDDVCYTLAVGRAHLRHRISFLFTTREQLATQLLQFIADPSTDSVGHAEVASKAPINLGVLVSMVDRILKDQPALASCLTNLCTGPLWERICFEFDGRIPIASAATVDRAALMPILGQFWQYGVDVDWQRFYSDQICRRVPLATYPFDRKRYWIAAPDRRVTAPAASTQDKSAPLLSSATANTTAADDNKEEKKLAEWFLEPVWEQAESTGDRRPLPAGTWLVWGRGDGPQTQALIAGLCARGARVALVAPG
ncbi:MAG: hypothetical protein K1X71_20605, partial [Pirellulales bacterium]|nr:hypothetical protein [Pirellulales bacterium]